MSNRFPTKVRELSQKPYYAILTEKSVRIPGDERSRTNPGHGYPESIDHSWSIEVFDDEESWKEEVAKMAAFARVFQAIKVEPAQITMEIKVS